MYSAVETCFIMLEHILSMLSFFPFAAILSHLKNPCLENDRKEAKQRYTDNLKAYTVNLLGRPLEKLHASLTCPCLELLRICFGFC